MKKTTLCVIFGGKSSEYKVSLASSYSILRSLDYSKYNVIKLGITEKGKWYIFEGENEEIINDVWQNGKIMPVTLDINSGSLIRGEGERTDVDVYFPALHGEYVEDGRLQGLFDTVGAKYVGCDAFSSHIAMDKDLAKLVAKREGIPVANYILINKKSPTSVDNLKKKAEEMEYPLFVKPCMSGSSVGVSRVKNEKELFEGIEGALKYCDKVLVEKRISGKEVELAIMEKDGAIITSTLGCVAYKSDFYDYGTKYHCDEVEYEIPAKISEKAKERVLDYGKRLFLSLGASHLSRIDFFVTDGDEVIFNEINTMPGFTEISMFPKLFMYDGFSFSQIIEYLIHNVLKN